MRVIWRYELDGPEKPVAMPEGSEILVAQLQGPKFCIWALVDPAVPKVNRFFRVYRTGQDIDIDDDEDGYLKHIQTLQLSSFGSATSYVVHIFELLPTLLHEVMRAIKSEEKDEHEKSQSEAALDPEKTRRS